MKDDDIDIEAREKERRHRGKGMRLGIERIQKFCRKGLRKSYNHYIFVKKLIR